MPARGREQARHGRDLPPVLGSIRRERDQGVVLGGNHQSRNLDLVQEFLGRAPSVEVVGIGISMTRRDEIVVIFVNRPRLRDRSAFMNVERDARRQCLRFHLRKKPVVVTEVPRPKDVAASGSQIDRSGHRHRGPHARAGRPGLTQELQQDVGAQRKAHCQHTVPHQLRRKVIDHVRKVSAAARAVAHPAGRSGWPGATEIDAQHRVPVIEEIAGASAQVVAVFRSAQPVQQEEQRADGVPRRQTQHHLLTIARPVRCRQLQSTALEFRQIDRTPRQMVATGLQVAGPPREPWMKLWKRDFGPDDLHGLQ